MNPVSKTIYGGKPQLAVAYCALHDGALTVHEMRLRGCLGKQCHHLQKNVDHPYWEERRNRKSRRTARKNAERAVSSS